MFYLLYCCSRRLEADIDDVLAVLLPLEAGVSYLMFCC